MTTNNYTKKREGIGSLFHDIETSSYTWKPIKLDMEYELFYTGRQAFKFILDTISETHAIEKIWMPSYYCQHVTRWIKKVYNNLHFYDINPFEFDKVLDLYEFASKNDVVLINNYWGLSDTVIKKSDLPIIIEDHSHGWLTRNCLHSNADYCFTSLRKTLPIPLGGISWKPNSKFNNSKHDFKQDIHFYEVFDRLHDAMKHKNSYKNGSTNVSKEDFLKVIEETEDFLDVNHEIISLRPQDIKLFDTFLNYDFLSHKHENLNIVYKQLNRPDFMRIVQRDQHVAFGLLVLFKEERLWASLKNHLISNDIYPSFLWPDNKPVSDWQYVLNIHVDFRYNASDMEYISNTINEWIQMNTKH
ncbi:hypothetical protein [Mariniflexile sp.]|uniref:hypothetical protein n=1 Tax=Mariniflexile sp. TaxID=1979402 RepID=UPI003561BA1C